VRFYLSLGRLNLRQKNNLLRNSLVFEGKVKPTERVQNGYLNTLLSIILCLWQGLDRKRDNTETAYDRSGLVELDRYNRAPTAEQ
jgi:hypothetical protein